MSVHFRGGAPLTPGTTNEIAVDTATPIGDVQVNCVSAPTAKSTGAALAAGDVYIAWLSSSAVGFNALTRKALYVLPGTCYQYSGSAWQAMDAYIYQSGEWVQFSAAKTYFYKDGDECTTLTGGWLIQAEVNMSLTKQAMWLQSVWAGGTAIGGLFYSALAVDVTRFKSVKMCCIQTNQYSTMHWAGIVVSTNQPSNFVFNPVAYTSATQLGTEQIVSADVSAISGTKFLLVQAGGTSSKFYEIWGE